MGKAQPLNRASPATHLELVGVSKNTGPIGPGNTIVRNWNLPIELAVDVLAKAEVPKVIIIC